MQWLQAIYFLGICKILWKWIINFCSVDNDILSAHIKSIIGVKIKWQLSLHFFIGHLFTEINFTTVIVSHSLKGLSFNFVFTDSICNLVV